MKKAIALLICLVLLLGASGARAEEPVSVSWRGHTLTPMYYEIYPNARVRVRVACDEVSMAELYNAREEFHLLRADGSDAYTAAEIIVLGEYLDGREGDRTTEFFDAVFKFTGKDNPDSNEVLVRFGDSEVIRLPRAKNRTDRTAFRTPSGAYVICVFSETAGREIAEQYAKEFKGKDVRLFLEEGIGDPTRTYTAYQFLQNLSFGTLSLYTPLSVGTSLDTEAITELALTGRQYELPVFTNVKKLTLNEDVMFPSNMTEKFPAVEELELLIRLNYAGAEFLSSVRRPAEVFPSLKSMKIWVSAGEVPPKDPLFRAWLEAQRLTCPGLTVNGEPAEELDLASGLDAEGLGTLNRVQSDVELKRLFALAGGEADESAPVPEGKVVIAVMDRYGSIDKVNTDVAPGPLFQGIKKDRKASSLEDARLVAFVYPVLELVGKYGGMFNAYSTETRVALVDRESGTLLRDISVATRQPPQSSRLGSGVNSGNFETELGIGALAELLG